MRRPRRPALVPTLARAVLLLLATGLGACVGGAPHPQPVWMRAGAGEADLAADREACAEEAMASVEVRNERREAEVRGTHFMKCMRERGWSLVLPDDPDAGSGPASP